MIMSGSHVTDPKQEMLVLSLHGGNILIFFTKFSPLFQASLYVGELKSFQGIEDIVVRRMKMR